MKSIQKVIERLITAVGVIFGGEHRLLVRGTKEKILSRDNVSYDPSRGKYIVEEEVSEMKAMELRGGAFTEQDINVETRDGTTVVVAETTDLDVAHGYSVMFSKFVGSQVEQEVAASVN